MKRGFTVESGEISETGTWEVFRRALRFAWPLRWRFVAKGALVLLSYIPLIFLPWPIKLIVDHVLLGEPLAPALEGFPTVLRPLLGLLGDASPATILAWTVAVQLILLVVIGAFGSDGGERDRAEGYLGSGVDDATRTENQANAGFSFTGGLLGFFDFTWTIRLSQALNHHYRTQLFERIQSLPMHYFDDERIGDGVYRLMYDTPAITEAAYRILLTPTLVPIGMAAVSLQLWDVYPGHPAIYLGALLLLPVSFLATLPFARWVRRQGGRSRRAGATTTSTLEEGMSNILAVQSLGAEDKQSEKFDADSKDSFSQYRRLIALGMIAAVIATIPALWVVREVFLYVIGLVVAGPLTPGDFTVMIAYFSQLAGMAVMLGSLWFRIQGAAPGLNRVFFIMDLPSEKDPPGATALGRVRESVRVENVDFDYPDGTRALSGVDIEAKVGEITGFVGAAGAGKTTLAYLIPRFLSPTRGRVTADGIDLAGVTHESLRKQIAFVFQENALFDGTVEENIRLGNLAATAMEVRQAARTAGADEFIRELPKGYDTPLGRAGARLSVGQKQRIAIARALVRDASILIFDEPTSALDPATERRLVSALRAAAKNRLVIVIAHRLSTIRSADQIVVLREGRVLERGSHAELMAREEGHYRKLVELQAAS